MNRTAIFEYNVVKQNYNKCFTNNKRHGKIKVKKRRDDYGTGND